MAKLRRGLGAGFLNSPATIHRVATGEWRTVQRRSPPWEIEDGERFLVEAGSGDSVNLDSSPCPSVQIGTKRGYLVELGFRTLLGARRVSIRRRGITQTIDLLPAGGVRAVELLMPAISDVERWLPRTRGAFWYLDIDRRPRRLIDPTRILAFASDIIPRVEVLVRDLEREPALRRTSRISIRPLGAPLDVHATEHLLRCRPELLEAHPEGPIELGGRRYGPKLIAYRASYSDFESPENRRLSAFLTSLANDCRKAVLYSPWLDDQARVDAEATVRALQRVVVHSLLRGVRPSDLPRLGDPPFGLEASHPIYRELRRLRMVYQSRALFSGVGSEQRKHLASADRVYQAWCCHLVAHVLGLEQTTGGLRAAAGPAFANDTWELFYDTPTVLRSWRSATSRPDGYRPDLVLRKREDTERIILIDAKYTSTEVASVSGDRLKEMQAYLNAFGIRFAGIMHPGEGRNFSICEIAGRGHRIVELSVVPRLVTKACDLARLRDSLLGLECTFGETFPEHSGVEVRP